MLGDTAGMRYASPALQDARAHSIQRCSLVQDKRHVDVQRLFCTISRGRHIGLAAMDSCDACHDRPSRTEHGRAVCITIQVIVIRSLF